MYNEHNIHQSTKGEVIVLDSTSHDYIVFDGHVLFDNCNQTECGCPSGGGINNGHIRNAGGTQGEEKKKREKNDEKGCVRFLQTAVGDWGVLTLPARGGWGWGAWSV